MKQDMFFLFFVALALVGGAFIGVRSANDKAFHDCATKGHITINGSIIDCAVRKQP